MKTIVKQVQFLCTNNSPFFLASKRYQNLLMSKPTTQKSTTGQRTGSVHEVGHTTVFAACMTRNLRVRCKFLSSAFIQRMCGNNSSFDDPIISSIVFSSPTIASGGGGSHTVHCCRSRIIISLDRLNPK